MKAKTVLIVSGVLWTLPYVVLGVAGCVLLWERGWSLWWLLLAAVSMILARVIYQSNLKRGSPKRLQGTEVEPSPLWTPAGKRAWGKIEELAAQEGVLRFDIEHPEEFGKVLLQVLQVVAREFHPRSSKPELEVSLPQVMLMAELVARDLKELLRQRIPGSHLLTLHDVQRLQVAAQWIPIVSQLYRLGMFAANPATGVIREVSAFMQGELLQRSTDDLQRWLLQAAIQKSGYYAIELYSGHLALRELEAGDLRSRRTVEEVAKAEAEGKTARDEPLRILVLGQVKGGKSSLINRLFGELRAAEDVVPRTNVLTPYVLRVEGEWNALIFDSAGYSEGVGESETLRDVTNEAERTDLLLWVCSATAAAREGDVRLLRDLRREVEKNPDRDFPPVLVVVTHIDQLRPIREWSPPYDLRDEKNQKSQNIRMVLETISQDLQIPKERVIPVCLKAGEEYNVESVMAGIVSVLPEARRLQCLRCLREHQSDEKWQRLWNQAREAGRVLRDLVTGASANPKG